MASTTPKPEISVTRESPVMHSAVEAVRAGLTLNQFRAVMDRAYFAVQLEQNDGNQCKVASVAGVHRNTIARTLRKYGLKQEAQRLRHG